MNYYNKIKNELIDNKIYKMVKDYSKNRSDLDTYYNVGKLLIEAQDGEDRAKYGDGLIKEYSKNVDFRTCKRVYIYSIIKNETLSFIIKYCNSVATIDMELLFRNFKDR